MHVVWPTLLFPINSPVHGLRNARLECPAKGRLRMRLLCYCPLSCERIPSEGSEKWAALQKKSCMFVGARSVDITTAISRDCLLLTGIVVSASLAVRMHAHLGHKAQAAVDM